jgi:hypothetical protein
MTLFTMLTAAALLGLCLASLDAEAAPPALRVSPNGRYLVTADGKPFFWLGDTAWSIRRIPPSEVDLYLSTRQQQGFTVIQIAPASNAGYEGADYAGNQAFTGGNTDTPNEVFWRDIDDIVDKAGRRGLHVVIFPLWGNDLPGLVGTDAEKARRLGRWVGTRYANRTHVLWAACGEYDAINDFRLPITVQQKAVVNALARGIREGTGGKQLMTIHPGVARDSSLDFHQETWLDLDMLQSGHQNDSQAHGMAENWELVAHDYTLAPAKPVVDGEPMYDDTPDAVWMVRNTDGPRADAEVMRRKAYWAVFAGACGHTYGHNTLFNFFVANPPDQIRGLPEGPGQRGDWHDALKAPAAAQLRHLRALLESRPFLTRIPDQGLIAGDPGKGLRRVQATRDAEGSYALLYLPAAGQTVTVDTTNLSAKRLKAWWYDPRNGKATAQEGDFAVGGKLTFTGPAEGPDWVLVLDDAGRGYRVPGGPPSRGAGL